MSITILNLYQKIAEQSPPAAQEKTDPSSSLSNRVVSVASDNLSEVAQRYQERAAYQKQYRQDRKLERAASKKERNEILADDQMAITNFNLNIAEQPPPGLQKKTDPSSSISRRVASVANDSLSHHAQHKRQKKSEEERAAETAAYLKKYREEHKEKIAEQTKIYKEANKRRIQESDRKRKKAKRLEEKNQLALNPAQKFNPIITEPPASQEWNDSNPSISRRVASVANPKLSSKANKAYKKQWWEKNRARVSAERKRKREKFKLWLETNSQPPLNQVQENRINSQLENSPLNGQLVQSQSSAQDTNGAFDLDGFEFDPEFLDDL